MTSMTSTFTDDRAFLAAHTTVRELVSDDGRARVLVAPEFQGRVMTSTCSGLEGRSCGYVHRAGVAAGARQPHITVLGGEDRFWLGPEGGQYGLYFAPGSPFDYAHWQVPDALDWGGWAIEHADSGEIRMRRAIELVNWSGTHFSLEVARTVRLLARETVQAALGCALPSPLTWVGFESDNVITHVGNVPWQRDRGLISIWILGMFPAGQRTTVVLPYQQGSLADLGPVVNDTYFGAIPPERIQILPHAVLFRGDGRMRGKLGLSARRARSVVGSYDADARALTLVSYGPPDPARDHVNSMWQLQQDPYDGDVLHSYNDGPLAPDQPGLGPFYEIETSSAALPLAPSGTLRHVHRTCHFEGPEAALQELTRRALGVELSDLSAS